MQDNGNDEDKLDQDSLAVEDENEGKREKLKHNILQDTAAQRRRRETTTPCKMISHITLYMYYNIMYLCVIDRYM